VKSPVFVIIEDTAFVGQEMQMRARLNICVILLFICCAAVGQDPNTEAAPPTKQDTPQKPSCELPRVVYKIPASPPASWGRKGPKSATTRLALTVDKKGGVKNPAVVQSGGKDVDREAMEAVRQWRFTPASCGGKPFEAQILVDVTIHLE
jgi:TonB family protein